MNYSHVIEIYKLKPGSIGKLLRRFQIDASDSREAGEIARKSLKRHEMMAVYQGSLDHQGRRTVGFAGSYTVREWERLRDALGGVEGVMQELARRSLETRG